MRSSLLIVALFGLTLVCARHTFSAPHEDDDNEALANAEDDLDQEELEENQDSEVAVNPAVQKIVSDVKSVTRALEEADLSESVKEAATDDANKIAVDAEELGSASPSRAKKLKLAIKKRMEALNIMLHSQEEEGNPAAKVVADVAHMRSAISASSLSAGQKSEANRILSSLSKDAKKISSHSTPSIKNKLHHEFEELKGILNDNMEVEEEENLSNSKSFEEEEEAVQRVVGDVKQIKSALKSAHLSQTVEKEAKANLDAILHDAEKIASASGVHRHNLEKAMKLRVAALREQLN